MNDQLLGPDAEGAVTRVSVLLLELSPDGQRAVAADLVRWLEHWARWIEATGSWDIGGC